LQPLLATISHHPYKEIQPLYTLREFVIPKRASYFPRDGEEKEENSSVRCEIKAFTYVCCIIVTILEASIAL
jgi:hypothetical protein